MSEDNELSYSAAIQEASTSISRFPLIPVKGIPLMSLIAINFDAISAFCPDSSDLLIATYPKAGTTWTQEIVDLLLHNGDAVACRRAPTLLRSPFLEIWSPPRIPSGLELLNKMAPPRIIKTHLPIQLVPTGFWENKCKTIYVARNAKDNMVSYYHFDRMNLTQPEPGPWEGYIHKFMRGELSWGSWYDHVKGYWEEREKRNILYIFYEDMKENPRREVERIMRYLDLSLSDDVIGRIVELTSFKAMKENPMANYTFIPKNVFDQSISDFMRKGHSMHESNVVIVQQWPLEVLVVTAFSSVLFSKLVIFDAVKQGRGTFFYHATF
ncbi:sulfotransferase 1C2 isoform X1 [Phyllopteryx taeniolatus]|uniref:sulfotransferase 1C2 isoform X1 n=1 Tax=Phyllopteryx taeniolatus TaxID=161469 RepID=UPI002AD2879E|nr:sulfotransferase 1C2 isoform X1 [Phyllopteryx taeniolatus]XP_061613332.1 sulfotransferase 1C2 isoform X1 [Phyllopteryx taeniolatus]